MLLKFLPCLILMVLPWIPCQQSKWQIGARRLEVEDLMKDQKRFVKDLEGTTDSLRQLRLDNERLVKDNEESFQQLHINDKAGTMSPDLENEQYLEVEKAEEGFVTRIDELEKHIQEQSAKRVEERYVYSDL
jgi:nitrate/nitrite-specific signal transduction histidine kinase